MAQWPANGTENWNDTMKAFVDVSHDSEGKIKTEALQADSTAPIADAALANKKYVDDISSGNLPTNLDSNSNAMLVGDGGVNVANHAYLAQTSGYVSAFSDSVTSVTVNGYVGGTNNPAGAGTKVASSQVGGNGIPFVHLFVPKGQYFEVLKGATSTNVTLIWTPLVSGGKPVDQD